MENNKIINNYYNEDAINYLNRLDNKSVDLYVLDPPYYKITNNKWDNEWLTFEDYLKWFEKILKKIEIKAKNSCSVWLFGFPYQLSYFIQLFEKYGFTFKQQIVIYKGLQSISGRSSKNLKMFPTATEHLLLFYKESRYKIRDILQKFKEEYGFSSKYINNVLGKATNGGGTWSSIAGKNQKNIQYLTKKDWNKLNNLFEQKLFKYDDYVYKFNLESGITDVWTDIKFYGKKNWIIPKQHPTQKPYKLIKRIINASSNKNDLVVDLFAGTGTTFNVAKNLSRKFSGCEINKKYYDLIDIN